MGKKYQKVVLAYSGGLDTSVCIPWLKEKYGCEVIAFVADVGQGDELEGLREKALASGASKVYIEDLRDEFVREYIFPTLRAGAVYERKYLLGTAMARPLIAKHQVKVALAEGADALAHGCTGKGNDQVRFELTYKALAPHLAVIAPWREWEFRSREDEIAYAEKHGIPVPVTREKPYSMDRNLWHISYEGGILEDPARPYDEEMFRLTVSPQEAPDEPEEVTVHFESGYPVALDGERLAPVELVERLNELGSRHGVGRVDIVENRLVGMKSRGVYETPGGTILYAAHQAVEELTLDRETLHFKEIVASKYAELVYYGLWFTTLRESLDAFVDVTQRAVNGWARVRLYKGRADVIAREASTSLYDPELATFGEDSAYDQKDAQGFINLFGLPVKAQAKVRQKLETLAKERALR